MTTESRAILTPRKKLIGLAALLLGLVLPLAPVVAQETADAHALVARGQTKLAAGDRGAGVLDLERARVLAPRAGFVRSALRSAGVSDPGSPVAQALAFVTSREWAMLATMLGWLAGLAFAVAILAKRSRATWKVALASTTAFFAAMLGVAQTSHTATAVVVTPDARALVAPYGEAAAAGPLPAGLVVVRGSEHGNFVRVRSDRGVVGWTPADNLEPVARPSS